MKFLVNSHYARYLGRQQRELILSAHLYLALRLVTGIPSRVPNFRHSTTSSPLSIRHFSRRLCVPCEKRVVSHPSLPLGRCAIDNVAPISIRSSRSSLSLSFSPTLSFFLSLFLFSLAHYCVTLKPKRLSLIEWTILSNVHVSCHLRFLRPARCERFSGPTGTDWTPAGRQPGGRRSCSCAPQPLLNDAALGVL